MEGFVEVKLNPLFQTLLIILRRNFEDYRDIIKYIALIHAISYNYTTQKWML